MRHSHSTLAREPMDRLPVAARIPFAALLLIIRWTRYFGGALLLLDLSLLAGCSVTPCPSHNGNTNGYCDGTSFVNCVQGGCSPCRDVWMTGNCPIGDSCVIVTVRPHQIPPTSGGEPQAEYAACSSWLDGGVRADLAESDK